MRRHVGLAISIAAFAACALTAGFPAMAQESGSPAYRSGNCTIQSGRSNGGYPAFPAVLQTRSHRIFAVWRLAEGHQDAGGSIMMSELLHPNQGCTWTRPRPIITESVSGYTLGPAGIAEGPDGEIIVGVVRYHAPTRGLAEHFRSYVLRSVNGGATWGSLIPVDAGYRGDISYPSSLAGLADGSLVMALYGNDNTARAYDGKWYVRLARSVDGGLSWAPWGSGVPVTQGRQWSEPQLYVDGSRLDMTLRYDTPGGAADKSGAFLVQSLDLGRTWSQPNRITSGTSGQPTLARLNSGLYALAYRDLGRPGSPFRYALSANLHTWKMGNDVTHGSSRRMLYAGFSMIDRSSSLVVYALENPQGDPHGWSGVYSAVLR